MLYSPYCPSSLSFSLVALTPPSAPSGGPNSAARVNSHGAKIKPATVKWPSNAIAVLNGTVICSQWEEGRELLILLTGSQMKITGPIMVWAVISGLTLLHAKDLGYFLFPYSSWDCDSLKWWINQTFWWLVFFCKYKAPGQVLFDYSAVKWGLDGCGGVL